jgi:hypothetical protein
MKRGYRAATPESGAAPARRPSSRWQLVQFKLPPTYFGRLSRVCVSSASPRYTATPYGSSGVLSTTGGRHFSGMVAIVPAAVAAAAAPADVSVGRATSRAS